MFRPPWSISCVDNLASGSCPASFAAAKIAAGVIPVSAAISSIVTPDFKASAITVTMAREVSPPKLSCAASMTKPIVPLFMPPAAFTAVLESSCCCWTTAAASMVAWEAACAADRALASSIAAICAGVKAAIRAALMASTAFWAAINEPAEGVNTVLFRVP